MKKTILCGLCALSLFAIVMPVVAAEPDGGPIKLSVNEADKAKYEALIKRYKDEAAEITKKAEIDIKAAQEKFDRTKAESEKIILNATAQIKKLQVDAENAKQTFDRVRDESNAKIEDANKRILQADEDLKRKIQALQETAQ